MNFQTKNHPYLLKNALKKIGEVQADPTRDWDHRDEDLTGAAAGRWALNYKNEAALFRKVTSEKFARWKPIELPAHLQPQEPPVHKGEQTSSATLSETQQEPSEVEQSAMPSDRPVTSAANPEADQAKPLAEKLRTAARDYLSPKKKPDGRGAKVESKKVEPKKVETTKQSRPSRPAFRDRDSWLKDIRAVFASATDFPAERIELCIQLFADAVDNPQVSLDFSGLTAALSIGPQMEQFAKWRSTVAPPLLQLTLPSEHIGIPAYVDHFGRLEELRVPNLNEVARIAGNYEQFRIRLGPSSQIRKLAIGCLNDADLDPNKTGLKLEYRRSLPVVVVVPTNRVDEDAAFTVTAKREFELRVNVSCKSITLLPSATSAQVRNFIDRCAQVAESIGEEPLRSEVRSATAKIEAAFCWNSQVLDLSECSAPAVQFIGASGLPEEFAKARSAGRCLHLQLNNSVVTSAQRRPLNVEPLQLKLPPGLEDPEACTLKFTTVPS